MTEGRAMGKILRISSIVLLALCIILSCTVVGNKLTDPASYSHTIEVLDYNRETVLKLSTASAVASAAISALPDDLCTPISEQLSELTAWFMLILSFVYLEKYLLTILAMAACYILLPAGCSALLVNMFLPRNAWRTIGWKLIAFGAAMLLVIPSGVWISDRINDIYAQSIEVTVQSAGDISNELVNDISTGNDESTTVIDDSNASLSNTGGSVARVIKQFKNLLNRLIEAAAVTIVTTCLIPIMVVIFFIAVIKALFNVPINVKPQELMPKKGWNRRANNDLVSFK